MKLEKITEPTATITLTLTELKRISEAHQRAIEYLTERAEDTAVFTGLIQQHESLKMCVDTVLADMDSVKEKGQ